jgi:hypothetical protein
MPDFEKMSFGGQNPDAAELKNNSPEIKEATENSSEGEKQLTESGVRARNLMDEAIKDIIANPNGDRIERNKG